MKRCIAALWTALSLALFSTAALSQALPAPLVKKSPVDTPLRVLFVGSSIMYYAGGLQTHTHRIAAAACEARGVVDDGFHRLRTRKHGG